ncbi:MAG: hypothetical protein J1E85_09145 [Ruminococcus sp.]|nr:hypothetical protein [Ruminococcus sp.]
MIPWDEYYPTIYEVGLAKKIFFNSLNENLDEVINGDMSKDTAISIAASEVWSAGRKYQDKCGKAIRG